LDRDVPPRTWAFGPRTLRATGQRRVGQIELTIIFSEFFKMRILHKSIYQTECSDLLERMSSEQVTLAYVDPPWHTNSNFSEREATDEDTLFLSKIIQQIRRILTQIGSLYFHCPPVSDTDFRLILNQIFGKQPLYEIIWPRKIPHNVVAKIRSDYEIILVYNKSDDNIYNPQFRPLSEDQSRRYHYKDEQRRYRLVDLISPVSRPNQQFDWKGYLPPKNHSWKFSKSRLDQFDLEGKIHISSSIGRPTLKQYLDEHPGVEIGTEWDDISPILSPQERIGSIAQRPIALLERIIKIGTNPDDLVFDPFSRAGTTCLAAQQNGRQWSICVPSEQIVSLVSARLKNAFNFEPARDFMIYDQNKIVSVPIIDHFYKPIVTNTEEISTLQQQIDLLSKSLNTLKEQMKIEGNSVEEIIAHMEDWISTSLLNTNQAITIDSYISIVKDWLEGQSWDLLDENSKRFLPSAELLFEYISKLADTDYSPFIIQYCRALENEILKKLFETYNDNLYSREKDIVQFLSSDLEKDEKGKFKLESHRFARYLQSNDKKYTLGDMNFIMQLIKSGGKNLNKSILLQDFRQFTLKYFDEKILEKKYLDQIDKINEDFRKKAAHPYILDFQVAQLCRTAVRECLNEFLLSYKKTH
jgi:DNA modification methylase